MNDTPRTDAAIGNAQDKSWMDGTLCRQLERELAAVTKERDNMAFRVNLAESALATAQARIKRLEEALSPLAQMTDIANDADCTVWKRAVTAQSVRFARSVLLEAKEAR
jgi:hypothetical protein